MNSGKIRRPKCTEYNREEGREIYCGKEEAPSRVTICSAAASPPFREQRSTQHFCRAVQKSGTVSLLPQQCEGARQTSSTNQQPHCTSERAQKTSRQLRSLHQRHAAQQLLRRHACATDPHTSVPCAAQSRVRCKARCRAKSQRAPRHRQSGREDTRSLPCQSRKHLGHGQRLSSRAP